MSKAAHSIESNDQTFAMSFREPNGNWFYLPTEPEARKWRGPYQNDMQMMRAATIELGNDVVVIRTTVNGPNKRNA